MMMVFWSISRISLAHRDTRTQLRRHYRLWMLIQRNEWKRCIDLITRSNNLAVTRIRQLNRVRLVEKEKDRLEEGKKEAEAWLRVKNEHVRAQSRLWQWYIWKCLVNAGEFKKKLVSSFFIIR